MEKVKPRTLSGFMELLPAPQVQMERIMQVLRVHIRISRAVWTESACR